MIFRIGDANRSMETYASTWVPKELELEKYLLRDDTDESLLDQSVFREPLLLVSNQVPSRSRSIALRNHFIQSLFSRTLASRQRSGTTSVEAITGGGHSKIEVRSAAASIINPEMQENGSSRST